MREIVIFLSEEVEDGHLGYHGLKRNLDQDIKYQGQSNRIFFINILKSCVADVLGRMEMHNSKNKNAATRSICQGQGTTL